MRKTKKSKTNKKIEETIGKVFAAVLLILIVMNLLIPDRKISENENRMLTQWPKLTVSSLLSGDFMTKYESYLADQFAGRDIWRSFNVAIRRLGGSKEIEDVFIGKDEQLLEDIVVPQQETLNENLTAIKAFSKKYSDNNVHMMLVPDAAAVLSDKLPALAVTADQSKMLSQVKRELGDSVIWLDAAGVLKDHKKENIYYKTDHHWTSLGAFYVFSEVASQMNIKTDVSSMFVSYPVSTTFNGVLASRSGCRQGVKETIEIYVAKETDNDVVVSYVDEQRKTTSLYDSSKLETEDQFAVFLGGNTSEIDIKTVSESTRRLLVIKDSFANSFIPFLTPFFREIVVVDPRYYSGTIQDIMDTYRITDTLFLYSGNTFFQDNNIGGVLGSE